MVKSQTNPAHHKQIERPSRLSRLAWLPVPLLALAIVCLWIANLRTVYESRALMVLLNLLFTWLASLLICVLTARGFLGSGQPGLLMFGCGSMLWGVTSLAAAMVVDRVNPTITVHNLGVCGAALCHFVGLLWRGRLSRPGHWLVVGYAGALMTAALIIWAALAGLLPVFFLQGQGGTVVREVVLLAAVLMFAWVAWQLILRFRRQGRTFYYWYGLGLALVATGLTGVLLLSVQGGIMGWTNRLTQYFGSAYLFVAALVAARETGAWRLSLPPAEEVWRKSALLAGFRREGLLGWALRCGLAVVAVAAAMALRLTLEACVGPGLPAYITLYPAIMVVALLFGFWPGLATTALAVFVAAYWVLPPAGQFTISSSVDRLGLLLFASMGVFMSVVAEFYRRHRHKAAAYDREAALRESQARLAVFAGATFEGIIESEAGRIMDCNEQFARITGYPVAELTGMEIASLVDAEDRERVAENIRQGQQSFIEHALLRKDGTRIFVEAHGQPVSPGSARRLTAVRDVTDRKRAEAVLQTTLRRFYEVFSSMSSAVLLLTDDGRVEFANQPFCDYFGLAGRPADLAGIAAREMSEKITHAYPHPEEAIAHIREIVDRGEPVRGEEVPMHNGRTCLRDFVPLRVQGQSCGRLWLHYDITERKQAEEAQRESERQFRTLADSIPNLAWWANGDGHITWYNRRWYEYTGTTPQQMEGWGWQSVHDPQALPAVLARWQASLATGQPFDMTFPLRGADGVFRPFLTRVMPLKDAQGRVQQWFGTNTDVSGRQRAEEAMRSLNAQLQLRVAELQVASEAVRTSRQAALGLAEEALESRREAERVNADLKQANESLVASRQAALNLMDDAVRARHDAEQATAESRSAAEQRRLALEAADLGAWDYQFQTGEVFWDERCREMWGIPQADHIDYGGAIAAIHAEDRVGVEEAVQRALAGKDGGAYHREFRVMWPDGSAHWIASHGRVYFQGEGEQRRAIRFVGANQEITDRKLHEEQLQKLNRTLKAHAKSDQALLRFQNEGEFLAAVCRIVVEDCGHAMVWVGYAEEDAARTVRPVAQAGFEEGYLETLNVTWAVTERGRGPTGTAIRTGQPCLCRNILTDPRFAPWRTEAIKRGYASSLVLPLLADDDAFGALTIYSRQPDGFSDDEVTLLTELAGDLSYGISALRLREAKERAETAQRQSEERYRGLVELSPEALFVNRNDRIVLVNPAALQLFGASSEKQLLGKSPFEVFHRESHAIMRERIRRIRAGERAPINEEKIVRLDGRVVDVEVVAAPVVDQGEQAILVLLRDITERKQAEVALQQTAADLQRSNRDLEQFAYVASHDLQEPLRAVGGYVKLLQLRFPDKLDEKARGYIAGAFDGATRMERLIGDLLAFSRVGTRGGAFAPANLAVVLDLALRNLETGIAASRATITHDPLPSLPVDATQIMQLFQNLIGNALKFQGSQPPRIHVGAQRQEGRWVFSVRDNGIGIEPQYYEKLFQIFHRLHTRKDYPGTGIGLAICKKIVERHGGKIWVESQPGQGSTFCFSIPEAQTS